MEIDSSVVVDNTNVCREMLQCKYNYFIIDNKNE